MVTSTEMRKVPMRGGAALGRADRVVDIAAPDGSPAAPEAAMLVSGSEEPVERRTGAVSVDAHHGTGPGTS